MEEIESENKRQNICENPIMSAHDLKEMLTALLDDKLKNIATKEDINNIRGVITCIQSEIEEIKGEMSDIKVEVMKLREEVDLLKVREKRMINKADEEEKFRKRFNVVVNGLEENGAAANKTFINICKNTLEVDINVMRFRKINQANYVFELASQHEVWSVLSNTGKLKDSGYFFNRDYTYQERRQRYILRQVKRDLLKAKIGKPILIKGLHLVVEERRYGVSREGHLIAFSMDEKSYVEKYLKSVGSSHTVNLQTKMNQEMEEK